jgi:hypothetical protein
LTRRVDVDSVSLDRPAHHELLYVDLLLGSGVCDHRLEVSLFTRL